MQLHGHRLRAARELDLGRVWFHLARAEKQERAKKLGCWRVIILKDYRIRAGKAVGSQGVKWPYKW